MAGRPRKPHKLRALEGGRGKSRPLTPDLAAPTDPLEGPAGLTTGELAAWKIHAERLGRLKIESSVDSGSFLAMVRHYCRANKADEDIEKRGLTLVTAHGEIRNPNVGTSRDSWKDYCALAQQFAMTPAARAKIGAEPKAPEKPGDVPAELSDASGGGT